MTKDEMVRLLKSGEDGIEQWNNFRKDWAQRVSRPIESLPDLSGADLSDVVFGDVSLHGVNFSNANLSNSDLRIPNISGANFYGANLEGANLSGQKLIYFNFESANLRRAYLSGIVSYETNMRSADLSGANLSGSELGQVIQSEARHVRKPTDFNDANLCGASLQDAILTEVDFTNTKFNDETSFKGANTSGCKVNRYTLSALKEYGGMTVAQRMDLDIIDDLAKLRTSYSGINLWLHLSALAIFLFPYMWFVLARWSEAQFQETKSEGDVRLWEALARYIWNGGKNWEHGWEFDYSFIAFSFMFTYNLLRGVLLFKTNQLERIQEISGLPVKFSLSQQPWWRALVKLMSWLLWFSLMFLAFNTWHFASQYVPTNHI